MRALRIAIAIVLFASPLAFGALPDSPNNLVDYPMPFDGAFPAISAAALLEKPAGKNGPVVARDGHFFTGEKRIRFWGVNIAFGGCFPTHENADAVAKRLSTFGINAVRFHHMDNQVFPSGIWADKSCEKLSPDALERLDYFIDALARQGIYSNINLHVSREWSKIHKFPHADQLPEFDKMVDLFDDDLITANRQYARDLLTHENAYRKLRYADDPAVCMVEINNENSLFLWGGEEKLANLPEPYAGLLNTAWNKWLVNKYGTRVAIKAVWADGATRAGKDLLTWTIDKDKRVGDIEGVPKEWAIEQHGTAKMIVRSCEISNRSAGLQADVTAVDGTDWHLQIGRPGVKIEKGKFYTVTVMAGADVPGPITLSVSQSHAPWENLGLNAKLKLRNQPQQQLYRFGFTASASDDNARIVVGLGGAVRTVKFSNPTLAEGGQIGLQDIEDPLPAPHGSKTILIASHTPGGTESPQRTADWFDFLQQTDEKHFVDMRDYLKTDLGVKCPITGTIGLGPLGTCSQSKMDFVDAHAYWDHPSFPHKPWDAKDWNIKNKPMVDNPAGATLWELAATRVAGKPFTVTEYNHAAPNEWAAECVPMIASFAALQDWDGVFLFAYSHNSDFEKGKIASYFDIEGNPTKMPFMPLASRIFLGKDTVGAIPPLKNEHVAVLRRDKMLATGSQNYYSIWPFVRELSNLQGTDLLNQRLSITFAPQAVVLQKTPVVSGWGAAGPGTGKYTVADDHGIIFAGFAPTSSLKLGPLQIEKLQTPFVSLMLVPADSSLTIEQSDRLLLAAVARAENTDMLWGADRKSVANNWGKAPVKIEVVKADLSLQGNYKVFAVTPDGRRGQPIDVRTEAGRCNFSIGQSSTIWYELERQK